MATKQKMSPSFLAISVILLGMGTGFFLYKQTLKGDTTDRKEPEQFTLIGTCDQEACLFESGKVVLGTATLRGYYKTTEEKIENYLKGDSGGKVVTNVTREFIVVSKTLSRDSVPLIEYLVPESISSTEDNVSVRISTADLGSEDKKILIAATEDKPVEVKVQSHTPTSSGPGPFAWTTYMDLLSVK